MDIRLVQNTLFPGQGVVQVDWLLLGDGTLDDTQALATAIIVALGTDRLADPSDELPDPDDTNRRGWWGDYQAQELHDGWPIGSRLWLLKRAKIEGPESRNGATTTRVVQYIRECIQPFIARRIGSSFDVEATRVGKEQIDALIRIYRGPITEIELRYAILWGEMGGEAQPPAPWAPLPPSTGRGRGIASGSGSAMAVGVMLIAPGAAKGAASSVGSTAAATGVWKVTRTGVAAGIGAVSTAATGKTASSGAAAGVGAASGVGGTPIITYTGIYTPQFGAGGVWGTGGNIRGSYRSVMQLQGSSQGKIRVTVEQLCDVANGRFSDCSHVSFGKWAGTYADCTATPIELTFNSGQHGFTGPRSGALVQPLVSDVITHPGLTLSAGDSIVIIFDMPTADATANIGFLPWGEPSSTFWWLQNVPLETWNITAPGADVGSGTPTQQFGVGLIETQTIGTASTVSAVGSATGVGAANAGTGTGTLLWSEEFTSYPSVASNATGGNNDTTSNWRYDAIWQDPNKGYRDFAGTSWNINPNDPAYAGYNPFSQSGSILTISAFRTPAPLVAPIRADLIAQGNSGLPDPAWCGGFLMTNSKKHKFLYGYIEFRARWSNPGLGMFPALWLYSSDLGSDPQGKGSAEFDLLEIFGWANEWHTSVHAATGYEVGVQNSDTGGWHTYGLDWQPAYMKVYKDNILIYTINTTDVAWFNNVNMDLIINFAMDANWFGSGRLSDGTTPSPMYMDIDYIRVYTTRPTSGLRYVDKNATGSNDGTSWANAWSSLSSIVWSSINPGDTIYISGGTYTQAMVVGASGTSGAPITITKGIDSGHTGEVILDGQNLLQYVLDTNSQQNLVIQNLTLQNSLESCVRIQGCTSGNSIVAQNLTIHTGDGVTTLTTNGTTAVGNNVLHFASVPGSPKVSTNSSLRNPTHLTSIPQPSWITAFTSTSITMNNNAAAPGVSSGDSIQVAYNARGADIRNNSGAVYFRNNTIDTPYQALGQTDGIFSYNNSGQGLGIYNNTITINNVDASGHSDSIQSFQDVVWGAAGNLCSHPNGGVNNHGILISDVAAGSTLYCYNNVVNMGQDYTRLGQPETALFREYLTAGWTGTVRWWNNTVYGGYVGYHTYQTAGAIPAGDEFKNNILYATPITVAPYYFNSGDLTTPANTDYNCVYHHSGNLRAQSTASTNATVRSTTSKTTGLLYFEVQLGLVYAGSNSTIGIANATESLNNWCGQTANSFGYWWSNGNCYTNAGVVATVQAALPGDLLAFAVDLTHNKIWIKNMTAGGGWCNDVIGNQNPATNTGGLSIAGVTGAKFIAAAFNSVNAYCVLNTGGLGFVGTLPAGFSAWDVTASFNPADISANITLVPMIASVSGGGVSRTWTQHKAAGYDAHGVNADPLFVVNGSNFHISTGSPAKDQGVTLAAPDTIDFDGVTRPQGPAYDMGAFEYNGTAWSSPGPKALAQPSGTTLIHTTDNIAAIMAASAAGDKFYFEAGTYRGVSIQPKNNQQFYAAQGAVFKGSALVATWTASGSDYYCTGQTQQGTVNASASCLAGVTRCGYPETVYYDGTPLMPVAAQANLATGKFYFDYAADRIYIRDNPAGHTVEAGNTAYAFYGSATNVTIQNFVVTQYATVWQDGAIGGTEGQAGSNWTIKDNEVSYCNGDGIATYSGYQIIGNKVHDNGVLGIAGGGYGGSRPFRIAENEVYNNGWHQADPLWEGGGIKTAQNDNCIYYHNYVHDNFGAGLWYDIDCRGGVFDSNCVVNNTYLGISYEISYNGTIRNNVLVNNGSGDPRGSFWQQSLILQNSAGCAVYGNKVDFTGSNGLMLMQQDRGTGAYGTYFVINNNVHDNILVSTNTSFGAIGSQGDYSLTTMNDDNNVWNNNTYYVSNFSGRFNWDAASMNFASFETATGESGGSISQTYPNTNQWITNWLAGL